MARANRHFIPGYIWHLTHRCHKREFLFKFSRDRTRWLQLLFEARKRYGLSILNYVVTSNHVHLMAKDNGNQHAIPKTIQYVAGRTAQEYNQRKNRKGAFWQDRYHATAIESGKHLWQCLVYVDMNMVRAGVVDHPAKWRWSGYNEIQSPRSRYRIIDHGLLQRFLNVQSHEQFAASHKNWVDSKLTFKQTRQEQFSKSVAVGSKAFIAGVKHSLGIRAKGRDLAPGPGGASLLKESGPEYNSLPDTIELPLDQNKDRENLIHWNNGLVLE